MISRYNILQNVVKQLREIARTTLLSTELRGFSFEYPSSENAPVRIRCRVKTPSNGKEQVGTALTKQLWKLASPNDFNSKFKQYLRLLRKANPKICAGWTRDKLEQLLEQSQVLAFQRSKDKLGAYFLFKKF